MPLRSAWHPTSAALLWYPDTWYKKRNIDKNTTHMKTLSITLGTLALLASQGCSAPQEKTAEAPPAVAPAPEPPAAAAFQPFDVVEIGHTVKDYGTWRKAFDNDSAARLANGLQFMVIGREEGDPNNLMVVLQANDVAKAKAFAADPRLKEVMDKNGVISKPEINYWHVIRHDPEMKEKTWVEITHRVKDFDAWLKVYDGEGTATRAAEGLYDVALARGVDDPNLVHIVFDIKDLAQAKASISSDKKKALMMGAGVEGPPVIKYYTLAE